MRDRLLACLLAASALLAPLSAHAKELEPQSGSGEGLYIESAQCPEGYILYAEQNVSDFVSSVDPNETKAYGPDCAFSLGTPFCFANPGSDVYCFPVLADGELAYLLRVYPESEEGSYSGVLSRFLVEELLELAPLTNHRNAR